MDILSVFRSNTSGFCLQAVVGLDRHVRTWSRTRDDAKRSKKILELIGFLKLFREKGYHNRVVKQQRCLNGGGQVEIKVPLGIKIRRPPSWNPWLVDVVLNVHSPARGRISDRECADYLQSEYSYIFIFFSSGFILPVISAAPVALSSQHLLRSDHLFQSRVLLRFLSPMSCCTVPVA